MPWAKMCDKVFANTVVVDLYVLLIVTPIESPVTLKFQ